MSQTIAATLSDGSPAVPTVTTRPQQKVIAATAASGIATPLAVLLLYILQNWGFDPPTNIKEAISAVFVAVLTGLAGYVCPPGAAGGSIRDSSGAV